MRKKLVIGNWKMHGSLAFTEALLAELTATTLPASVTVAVCPPSIYLREAAQGLTGKAIGLGAQNCSAETEGAFTGEVSADMLADVGCQYVLLGHSERRAQFAETDAMVARKCHSVFDAGLHPVLCLGETAGQREAGETLAIVERQLQAVLLANESYLQAGKQLIVAYEPVWAIGTGLTASPEQAQEVHAFIRQQLNARNLGQKTPVLYGGSVKADNATELFACEDIDGGLIGGASLKAADFLAICQAAS